MVPSKFQTRLMGLQSSMMSFAMILTANSKDAYNLVQDATLDALDREQDYSESTNFKGWVYTLMRNIFISNYSNAHIAAPVIQEGIYNMTLASEAGLESPEGSLSADQVSATLLSLPKECSEVVTLHITGYTANEIADRLDMSLGTVRRLIKQGIKAMTA